MLRNLVIPIMSEHPFPSLTSSKACIVFVSSINPTQYPQKTFSSLPTTKSMSKYSLKKLSTITWGRLVTPTVFPPFLRASNISAPTSSKKNFGRTDLPTLKLEALIPKKHAMTIIFKPISFPSTQTKGYRRTKTMALISPPASKATSMKYGNKEEDFNNAFSTSKINV